MIYPAENERGLDLAQAGGHACFVKTISLDEAERHFRAVCEDAFSGEVIRLRMADGSLLELTHIGAGESGILSDEELNRCYEESDWAAFESRCAAASH